MILNLIHESGCKTMDAQKHIYICDHKHIEQLNYGYHRLHHVLSFCVSQNIEIIEGNIIETCQQLIQEWNITHIILQESDDKEFIDMINALSSQVSIKWIKSDFEVFIQSPPHSSFFSFFKMIEPHLKRRGSKH